MQRIFKLAKVLRRCAKADDTTSGDTEDDVVASPKAFFLPILGIVVAVGLFFLTNSYATFITAIGGEAIFLSAVFTIVGVLCIVLTFIELLNTLYMSSELTALITMPFSAFEIVGARIFNAARTKYLVAAVIAIPSCLGFGLATGVALNFYLFMLLGFVLVPFFAILITSVLIIFIMTFVRIFRNRDLLSIIGVIIVFIAAVAYVIFTNSNTSMSDIGNGVLAGMQTASSFSSIIPIVPLLVGFYSTGDPILLVAALGLIAVALFLLWLFVKLFYLRGAMAIRSSFTSYRKIDSLEKITQQKSSLSALTRKELRTIFRTPAYYLNGWLITLLWPIVAIIPFLLKINFSEMMSAMSATDFSALAMIATAFACILSFSIAAFITSANNLAYTAISRDGQSFFINKNIPVPAIKQLRAKRNAALIICLIGSTLYTLIIALILIFAVNILPWWSIFPILITSISTVVLVTNIQINAGVKSPNLDWTDESAVGKQSSTAILIIAIILSFGLPLFALFNMEILPPMVWVVGFPVVMLILACIVSPLELKSAAKQFSEI